MTEANETDERAPWTIKSVRVETRDLAVRSARAQGVTMGEWMDRAVPRQAEADKGNQVIPPGQPGQSLTLLNPMPERETMGKPVDSAGLESLANMAMMLGKGADMPGIKGAARDAAALLRDKLREARGMPPRRPRGRHEKQTAGQTLDGSEDDLG